MENNELHAKLEELGRAADPFLEEGKTYYRIDYRSRYGSSSNGYYSLDNGKRVPLNSKEFRDATRSLSLNQHFPAFAAVRYTLRKGQPAEVAQCTPEQILELFPLDFQLWTTSGYTRIESRIKFLDDDKMDIAELRYASDKQLEGDNSLLDEVLLAFYHATGKQLQKAYLQLSDAGVFVLQTTPALPGLTSEIAEQAAVLSLDVTDLNAVYAFLESCDETKVAYAVAALAQHDEHRAKAEKRYRNWIRTRLKNPNAGLQDFVAANPRKALINNMLTRNIAKDFISISYFDDDESQFVVDFIGSMIKNVLNLEAFVAEAKATQNEDELAACYARYAQPAKAAILAQANDYPDGWVSRVIHLIFGLPIRRLLFEKTKFDLANFSPVLREFMFYWNMQTNDEPYFDIFQSDEPNLTDIFWLLPQIPETAWGDTTPQFPDSPLSFSRVASYRIGDGNPWKVMKKPN